MTNWKTYAFVAVIVTASGFVYIKNSHKNIPADFRDAVAGNEEFDTAIPALKENKGSIPVPKATAVEGVYKGYVGGNNPSAGAPSKPLEWVPIKGGKFMMGTDDGEKSFSDAKPVHQVIIKTFEMSKTLVTVEQYAECVTKGKCTRPTTGEQCNWGVAGRQFHPVNCVDWAQANQYAKFKGARLPSEAEWEYAATSGGKNQKYPWGNTEATCDKAVMAGPGGYGCSKNGTMPVCSKTAGNTAQGLCDMAGNVWQWVQDKHQNSYKGAPVDGKAFEGGEGANRVVRGGAFNEDGAKYLRAEYRAAGEPSDRYGDFGFRLARERPFFQEW